MEHLSHAWVESPLQLISAIEAHRGPHGLIIYARIDAEGMTSFLDRFSPDWLPHGVRIIRTLDVDPVIFTARGGRLLIGDICSGKLQRAMLAAAPRFKRRIVVLDDGFATLHAMRLLISSRIRPLVRARQKPTGSRTAAGYGVAVMLRTTLQRRQLSWTTALPVPDELIAGFVGAGGRLHRHSFDFVRSLPETGRPLPGQLILGSAMVADGLIDAEAYLDWLAGTITGIDPHGQTHIDYLAHRRETPELLTRVAAFPGIHVRAAGLPAEIRLTRAPAEAAVHSLPTSAIANLPATMRNPQLTVTEVPAAWWTGQAPDELRRQLNDAAAQATREPSACRVVAIADSESYLKWASRVLDSLGPDVDTHLWLMDSPIRPTDTQIAHALAGSSWAGSRPPVIARRALRAQLSFAAPDVVLAAATGPVVQQIAASAHSLDRRPGLATGLPGIGLPAHLKGVHYRRDCDLLITHSRHERDAYRQCATEARVPIEIAVARLPLLTSPDVPRPAFDPELGSAPGGTEPGSAPGSGTVRSFGPVPERIVFAPQAKVPTARSERIAILLALAGFVRTHQGAEAIVKVRSLPGEQETHHEEHTYLSLIAELESTGHLTAGELAIATGPMSEFLTPGSALVTVSSTAALESIDRGLQTLIISDFGVSDDLLNAVFTGSGILGTLADVTAGRIGFPAPAWLEENYFQAPTAEVPRAFAVLAARSQHRQLPGARWIAPMNAWRRVRAELRTAAPQPVVDGYRATMEAVRSLKRRLR